MPNDRTEAVMLRFNSQRIRMAALGLAIALVTVLATGCGQQETESERIFVGHLVDYTGPTAFVGKSYGQGVADAIRYINAEGGIGGVPIDFETVDYAYKVPQAIAAYKRWVAREDIVFLQGWGTADTEASISFVTRDQVPVISASYSGHLTDPSGKNPETKTPAPYNFFYGPSYSDGCRALVQWAAADAADRGLEKPRFVHVGDNHPYPNAPKKACREYAEELGFEVLPPVAVPMTPGDFKAQCLTLREAAPDYAYLANIGSSIVALMSSCRAVGTEFAVTTNIWGADHATLEATPDAELVFPTSTPFWDDEAPGMELVRAINAQGAGPEPKPTHHYLRGVCAAYYMKEAMEWARDHGGVTGANIRAGMYARRDWVPAGLEGICLPSTWTEEDHRGTTLVTITRGINAGGEVSFAKLETIEVPRREEWLGY